MISGSVQTDIGKKLVNLVLHKYLDRSLSTTEKRQQTGNLVYYGAFAVSMRKEMEFMSNTKKEIEIKKRRIFVNNKIRKQPLRPVP